MLKGFIAVALASVFYGIYPLFIAGTEAAGVSSATIVFFRFTAAAIMIGIFMLVKKISFKIEISQLIRCILIGVIGSGCTSFFLTYSYELMPVGIATMLHFSYPMVVILAMTLIFKEKFNKFKAAAIVCAVIGLVLISDLSGTLSIEGMIFALLSSITYSIFIIANKKTKISKMNLFAQVFYMDLAVAVFFGCSGFATNNISLDFGIDIALCLVASALISTVFAVILFTYGVRKLGASNAAVVNMIEPVTSVAVGVAVYGEILNIISIVGCIFIILSSFVIALEVRSEGKNKE